MHTATKIQTIPITHGENHLSLANRLMSKNGRLNLLDGKNTGYELKLYQLGPEDGSGNKFIFKANLISLVKNGRKIPIANGSPTCYLGYLNILTNRGHIQFHPKSFTW